MWGWLRLILGAVQMTLAAAAVGAYLDGGSPKLVWTLAGAATAATLVSLLIYRRRQGPPDTQDRA